MILLEQAYLDQSRSLIQTIDDSLTYIGVYNILLDRDIFTPQFRAIFDFGVGEDFAVAIKEDSTYVKIFADGRIAALELEVIEEYQSYLVKGIPCCADGCDRCKGKGCIINRWGLKQNII